MLSPRWSKALKDLWGNKLRTSLVVLSISVGVFAVGMIATVNDMLTSDMSKAYSATTPAHAVIYTDRFDAELVNAMRAIPDVADAEGRRNVTVRFSTGPGQWRDLELIVLADFDNIRMTKVYPQAGVWPPPYKEMLLERASVDIVRHTVGESLLIEAAQGRQRTLKVAGLAHDMDQPPAAFVGRGYGYITMSTLEWLGYGDGYGNMLIRVREEHAHSQEDVQAVVDLAQAKIERSGRTVYGAWVPQPGRHPVEDVLQPMVMILGVLGLLSLFLSGFLVINTISAVLTQQIKQIGIMKTVGATNKQIMQLYYSLVLAYSMLALTLGIPLGAFGGFSVGTYLAKLLNFDLANKGIPLPILLLEVAVGLLVPFIAALWPIRNGARITVREALSAQGIGKGGNGREIIDRLLERVRGISRPVLLSIRNTFRRKGRLVLTMATLTLGGAIFVSVLCVHTSLGATLNDALLYWNYDVEVRFGRAYRINQLVDTALQVPGVVSAESWGQYGARRVRPGGREGDNLAIVAPPIPTTMLNPIVLEGRWLLPEDENAIVLNTDVLKKETDVGVGDMITFKINGRESSWRVVGIVRGMLTGTIAYANYPYAARISRGVGRASQVLMKTESHDAASQARLAKALEAHFKATGYQVRSTDTIGNLRQMIQSQFNILIVFLLIMAVLLAVVGGLGLMGTMSINVLERTREIGVMRAIGASNMAIVQVFLVEGVFIGVLSWLLSIVLSLPLSQLLSDIVGNSMLKSPLSYTYSVAGAGLWLAIVVALAGLASLLPAWKAARLTVRDVLAYE